MSQSHIRIRGARTHNLKNVSLDIPRDRFVVITGLSGSGKSSLAFDTLYAEGQRRYVESLSASARQVLELMAHGYSNQAIGEKLSISVKTVEAHRARLFKKLGASNVADAVLLAIRVGLVTP